MARPEPTPPYKFKTDVQVTEENDVTHVKMVLIETGANRFRVPFDNREDIKATIVALTKALGTWDKHTGKPSPQLSDDPNIPF